MFVFLVSLFQNSLILLRTIYSDRAHNTFDMITVFYEKLCYDPFLGQNIIKVSKISVPIIIILRNLVMHIRRYE